MQIQVTKNKVILPDNYIVNKGEYHVNVLEFLFSEEYTNEMVKKAIFVSKDESIEQVIIGNKCHIPNEMLNIKNFELRVYAYEIENGELVLRYSPTYAIVYLREGSYKSDTSSEETITPTQFEQFEQALNNGLNELESGLEEVSNVDIDASKNGNTTTVTITDRQGTEKSVEIFDGDDYVLTEEDKQGIINTVKADVILDIPTKVSQFENDSEYVNKEVNNLTNYTLKTNTGSSIELLIDNSTYVMTLNLKNLAGTTISTGTIDLPLETMIIGAIYDNTNKKIVLNLKNGSTTDVPVADLISGLQSEITNANKLSADLVDDTSTTNKFTSTSEKNSWNTKYDKPSGGIPSTDMSSSVRASLEKADTAIQDVSDKEDKSNKVTTLSSGSTDTQYPSAKAVYDELEDIKAVLDENDIKETENWLKGWFAITTNNDHHGCEWYPFSTSNTTSVERLYNSVGLSITPATDTIAQIDNLPEQFKSFSCNFFVDNEGVKHITAIKGMSNNYGETEDTIKNVVYKGITYKQDLGRVRRTRFYNFGLNSNSKFEYDFYWTPKDGYVPTPMAINKDGSISPFYVIASCVAGLDSDGQLRSLKGLRPAHYLNGTTTGTEDISTNICYSDCISLFHNRGQYYSAGLMCEYMNIALDFYLKFGTRDTQSIMKGNTSNNYQYAVSYAESNVSRVVLTTAQANNIDLLSCVSVGDRGSSTSTDRAYKYFHNIANDVRVIGKEIIDESHTALILDHAPFTTTSTTCVSTMHEVSGFSDYVLGDYGSPISNTNGKHGFVFDGIEIGVGGYEVAGNAIMNIVNSTGKREIYITNDVSQLSSTYSTIQSTYNKSNLAIQPTTLSAWNYITKMEVDLTNGLFVPTECGQSGSGSSVGFADGCYIDSGTSGQREFLWLGHSIGNANGGLSCLLASNGITNALWTVLARLSINGVGGELAE